MAHKLVYYGNETLRKVADDVINVNQEVIDLIDSMYNIMYRANGIGLAAPQVDISKRILVIDLEMNNGPTIAIINPEIISCSDKKEPYEEGCLSFPGIAADIIRPSGITIKGISPEEKEIEIDADGLFARVLQHEIDHLNGVVFIDHLDDYIRKEFTYDLKKIKKLNRK